MPIYGYVCQACGHSLDALQKIADDPLVDCPACGAAELKRQLSAPRFRLKGGGWYETDFKSDNQRNLAGDGGKKDASKSGDGAAKSDGKSGDSKSSATKPESKPAAKASSD